MAPHSSTLAWKVPWMEEPGGLQSMGSLSEEAPNYIHTDSHSSDIIFKGIRDHFLKAGKQLNYFADINSSHPLFKNGLCFTVHL